LYINNLLTAPVRANRERKFGQQGGRIGYQGDNRGGY